MREKGRVYFAPNVTFAQFFATTDPYKIVEFYNNRIISYYFDAAETLIRAHRKEDAFAAGLICFASIDAIASIVIGGYSGPRFKALLREISEFHAYGDSNINRVYKEFRCGLVHEAKIHNAGQFTYDIKRIIELKHGIISINPEKLLEAIRQLFYSIILEAKSDIYNARNFSRKVKKRFKADVEFIKDKLCQNCGGTGTDPNTEQVCEYCDGSGYDPEGRYDNELERADDASHLSN